MILLEFVRDLIKNCLLVIFVNKVFLTDEMLKFALVLQILYVMVNCPWIQLEQLFN